MTELMVDRGTGELLDRSAGAVHRSGGRAIGALVDAYGTGNYLPAAFNRLGVDVIHVQSAAEPISRMQPWDRSAYLDSLVYDPDGGTERALAEAGVCFVLPGQEPGVLLADRLSEALGVRSNGTTRSDARRDKHKMTEAVSAAGLRTARQLRTADVEEAVAWAEAGGHWPCVAKPLASASTDGVTVCRTAGELRSAFRTVLSSTTVFNGANTEVLVQSYLEGTEYIVDTVSVDGRSYVCGVWRYEKRLLANGKPIYNRDILLPSDTPVVAELADYTRRVLDVLHIRHGPAHTEIIVTDDGPALVEVGARVNGHLHPAFHDRAMGVNSADLTALAYLRPRDFLARYADGMYERLRPAAVYNAPTLLSGTVVSVDEDLVREIRSRPSVVDLVVKRRPGDAIVPTHDLLTSPLRVFLTHPDPVTLEIDYRFIESVRESVFRVRPAGPRAACGLV